MTRSRKAWLAAVAGAVAIGLAGAYIVRPASSVVREEVYRVPAATSSQLERAASLKTFFAHQSVGGNMIDAVPAVYAAAGVQAPEVIASDQPQSRSPQGYIQHVLIGKNGDPLGKITEFDHLIRSGIGDQVDVAALKLCYVDFHSGDDTDEIFQAYRNTLDALQRDFPAVTFVAITVPVTTEQGIRGRTKDRLGLGEDPFGPQHNVTREDFNAKVRAEYANTGRLFDISAVQSTSSDGVRIVRAFDGTEYFSMDKALAKDPGHLNAAGAALATSDFLEVVASASALETR